MIEQAHAERMKAALESIVDGLRDWEDRPLSETYTAAEVLDIAERALNPDEWTRIRE